MSIFLMRKLKNYESTFEIVTTLAFYETPVRKCVITLHPLFLFINKHNAHQIIN